MNAVKVDDAHRIRLRILRPGDCYEADFQDPDLITLRRVAPVTPRPAKVRFEKRGHRTVGVTDRQISLEAIQEAATEFP